MYSSMPSLAIGVECNGMDAYSQNNTAIQSHCGFVESTVTFLPEFIIQAQQKKRFDLQRYLPTDFEQIMQEVIEHLVKIPCRIN